MLWKAIALAFIAAFSGTLGIWASERNPPEVILAATTENAPVAPGALLRIQFEIERYRSCALKVDRMLFDSGRMRATLEDVELSATSPLGRTHTVVDLAIPRLFREGSATYHTVASYRCNLLHWLFPIIEIRDVPFEVRGPTLSLSPPVLTEPVNR